MEIVEFQIKLNDSEWYYDKGSRVFRCFKHPEVALDIGNLKVLIDFWKAFKDC